MKVDHDRNNEQLPIIDDYEHPVTKETANIML